MTVSFGIDFGTSTTKVSISVDNGPPIPLDISETGDKQYMPSVIAYKKTAGEKVSVFAIGEAAERVPNVGDYWVIRDIKRFLEVKDNPKAALPFGDYKWWDKDNNCVDLSGTKLELENIIHDIVAEALNRAVRRARQIGKIPVPDKKKQNKLVEMLNRSLRKQEAKKEELFNFQDCKMRFGCSVTAGLSTRSSMRKVGNDLGFTSFRFDDIREEPVLASVPYLKRELRQGDLLLVYDFGGGTFDTAVISVDSLDKDGKPSITVLAADGEAFCGGTDIDKAFAEYLARRIAQDYFENDSTKIPEIKEKLLEGRARDIKVLLSDNQEYRLELPPGFMGRTGIALSITRQQFDKVLLETQLLQQSTNCVLRVWRKARMIYRKQDETPDGFTLKMDQKTGIILKDFNDIEFTDLNEKVSRVLLVGGTTRIPLVQKHLASILDKRKFISENDPSEPLVACSLGAASRNEQVSSIIDRLPFSIIIRDGENFKEMYQAYVPTVSYKTITDNPRIESYVSRNAFTVSSDSNLASVECVAPDGNIMQKDNLTPGRYVVEIDCYGRIFLKPSMMEIINPAQHDLQKAQLERLKQVAEQNKIKEEERTRKNVYRKPGEDYNTDVG